MKKLAAILFTVILLGGLAACQPKATPSAPPPTPTLTRIPPTALPRATPTEAPTPALNSPNLPPLQTFKMFAPMEGWGLVANQLLLTHNGGQSWYSVPLPGGQVNQDTPVLFLDAKTLFVLLPAADGQSGQLYISGNGGGTWSTYPVPFLHGQFSFVDSIIYFLETRQTGPNTMTGTIYRTDDRGQTWHTTLQADSAKAGVSLPEAGLKTGFSFIRVEKGWMGTTSQPGKVLLYETANNAATWVTQDVPSPQNIGNLKTNCLPPVFFTGDYDHGLLPVDFIAQDTGAKNRIFYSSTNGGDSWSPGASVIDGGAFTFIDAKDGWVWGKHGLYYTNDAALTWQLLPVAFGPSEQATMLSFVNLKNGWIVTTDAKNRVRLYSTKDGGNTWVAINQ